MLEYIDQWNARAISATECLRLAALDLKGIQEEFAPELARAKEAEALRKRLMDAIKPVMDVALAEAPSGVFAGVRLTRTNPKPKTAFDTDALQDLMDELASYGGADISSVYILQRLAEAKTTTAASAAYKAEIVKEK